MDIITQNLTNTELNLWEHISKSPAIIRGSLGDGKSMTLRDMANKIKINNETLHVFNIELSAMARERFSPDLFAKYFSKYTDKPTLIIFNSIESSDMCFSNTLFDVMLKRSVNGVSLPEHTFVVATENMLAIDSSTPIPIIDNTVYFEEAHF